MVAGLGSRVVIGSRLESGMRMFRYGSYVSYSELNTRDRTIVFVIAAVVFAAVFSIAIASFSIGFQANAWAAITLGLAFSGQLVTALTTPEAQKKKWPYVVVGLITLAGVVVTGIGISGALFS